MPRATPLGFEPSFEPTLEAALARIAAVRPGEYARTRNALDGAVTGLSPYITHGFVSLADVLAGVCAQHPLDVQHKFVFELGWRAYYRHVWQHRGAGILESLRKGLLPDSAYCTELPEDIAEARTGVPVIDQSVRTLYATGMLHNHARMWLASYVVHIRKVHWKTGADWLYAHLLDGDLASNHLSWQWVAGTGSSKPYLFNAENVARYAPEPWHSPGSVIDTSYEALDRIARQSRAGKTPWSERAASEAQATPQPPLLQAPPPDVRFALAHPAQATDRADATDPAATVNAETAAGQVAQLVAGREVWLVHPWSLGPLPADLPANTLVLGVCIAEFHQQWPWSERRWRFVGQRMAEVAKVADQGRQPMRYITAQTSASSSADAGINTPATCWYADAATLKTALARANSVRSVAEPHLSPWLETLAECSPAPALFAPVDRRCDSFSQWWNRVTKGVTSAEELLAWGPQSAGARAQSPLAW
jgi:deoxyribodipyrimidine photo-lyase